jgi:two-component system cell cycle sensor histidine kinase/response regulator CckA
LFDRAVSLESRELADLLDAVLEGFQVVDRDYRYVHVNEAAARHGRTTPAQLVGKTMMECYPGIETTEVFALIRSAIEDRAPHLLDNAFTFADGSVGHFELRIQPVPAGACVLSIDVTARKEAERERRSVEERLRHAQRMEAVGQLAAGIAHDFNNLLTVMLSQGELAVERPEGPTRADVETMLAAARSAAELTQSILAYGRRTVLVREVVDVHEILRGLEALLRPTLGGRFELVVDAAPNVGRVEADRTQIEQVVMNLVLNARDAMSNGGRITITLGSVVLDESHALTHPGSRPGRHAKIVVTDTGSGMDAATRARVFEPFFTTKELGRGTGLGLATVYGIVKQHEGTIWVESELGRGTTFEVFLPTTERAELLRTVKAVHRARDAGGRVILVAEDSALLRKLIGTVLTRAGYEPLLATCGEEALELWAEREAHVGLLLTDLTMPGIGGHELIARVRAARPALPVICTSGYADALGRKTLPDDVLFVEKPFSPSVLLELIERAIRAADASSAPPIARS